MTARVVRAEADHFAAWSRLRAMLWPDDAAEDHAAAIRGQLVVGGDLAGFVAIDGDAVVGFAEASIRHDHVNGCETSPAGFLEGIAVDPAHRRAGIARGLIDAVADWARAQGCAELGSDTDVANGDGQALHLCLGFEERERVVFYRRPL